MTDGKATELIAAVNRLADLYEEMTRPQRKVQRSMYEDARIVNELVQLRATGMMPPEDVPEIYKEIVEEEVELVVAQKGLKRV